MKNVPVILIAVLIAVLCSCESSVPTEADMDRYYQEAERRAGGRARHT